MRETIQYHIGKEVSPLDMPPFRAYFSWVSDGQLIRAEDYSREELQKEIQLRQRNGEDIAIFVEALKRLA